MIRGVAITSLVTLLMLVLYLPAATPPATFLERIRSEYFAHGATWGQERVYRALEDALVMLEHPVSAPLMNEASARQGNAMTVAEKQFDTVSRRILDSDYLRAFNALALLASFRLMVLAQLAPGLILLATAYIMDGLVRRWVKGREFAHYHPEVWAGSVCSICIACCAAIISSVLPVSVPLTLLPVLAGCASLGTAFAIANYPVGQTRH